MADIDLVRKHLSAIVASVAQLRRHVPVSNQTLRGNPDLLWIIERGLYLCIQNLLDCFAHIIAADFSDQWDTYAEAAAIVRKHGVIDDSQEDLLRRMISVRNRLSHQYMVLDVDILMDVVNNKLDDVLKLANAIAHYSRLPQLT
jgi:uncharacterized protein YutE (UPF0331/DUF86 family)